jgi:hypothetical protein
MLSFIHKYFNFDTISEDLSAIFILLYSLPSQHNIKNSLTFTVYNEFIGLNGMTMCYMFQPTKPSSGSIH